MKPNRSIIGPRDLSLTMLEKCPQLKCLGLPHGLCTDLLPSLAPKGILLHVHLQLKMGIEEKLADFLNSNKQITQLSLQGPNEITKVLEDKFLEQREILGKAFKTLGNLESLHLEFDFLEPCSFNYIPVIFSDITAYKHLKHIDLAINVRVRESVIHEGLLESLFKALLGSKSIEKLSIYIRDELKDTTIDIIRKFLKETISLKELDLDTEWDIKAAKLGELFTLSKSVTKLGLTLGDMSMEGVFGLMEGLEKNSTLRNIDLAGENEDDELLEAFYNLLINNNQNSKSVLQKITLYTALSDINVLSSIFEKLEDPNNEIHKNKDLLNMDIYIDSDLNLHREDPDFDLDLHKEIRYKKKCYTYRVGDIN